MKINKNILFLFALFVSFTNYLFAKYVQTLLAGIFPGLPYVLLFSSTWFIEAGILLSSLKTKTYLIFDWKILKRSKNKLLLYVGFVLTGILIFTIGGITKYFDHIKY